MQLETQTVFYIVVNKHTAWLDVWTQQFQGEQIINILNFPSEVSETIEVLSFGWMMPIVSIYVGIET